MTLYFNTAVVKEGGAEPVIESLNITPSAQQQFIEAPTGIDGYSPITVEAVEEDWFTFNCVTDVNIQDIIRKKIQLDTLIQSRIQHEI